MTRQAQDSISQPARVYPALQELIGLKYKARGFSFLPRQPVQSLLSGRHGSRMRGRGLTFEELRRYRPGDDIRTIDWRATARLRQAQVRVYTEERDRPVLLIVDQRSSMFFGSARTTKATTAAELAALAAWRSLDVGDRVGMILLGDDDVFELKPRCSQSNVLRGCHQLVEFNRRLSATGPASSKLGINQALRKAINVATHDHLVVLITDFAGSDAETKRLAARLASHNDVLAMMVYDPLGIRLPVVPGMEASDGLAQLSLPHTQAFGKRFEAEFARKCAQIREQLQSIRIPAIPICTHDPVYEQLLAAFGGRR